MSRAHHPSDSPGVVHKAELLENPWRLREAVAGGYKALARDLDGNTALHHSAEYGFKDTIHVLVVEYGAPLDSRNDKGETPLHGAAYFGYVGAVQNLIALGADVLARDGDGLTPRDMAIAMSYDRGPWGDIAALLKEAEKVRARKDALLLTIASDEPFQAPGL